MFVRRRRSSSKHEIDQKTKYYSEEEALIAKKLNVGVTPTYNINRNEVPNNKLKNHYNLINNIDRRENQVLIQNNKLYKKPTIPDNPHVTIHNNLKSTGTEI